MNEHEAELNKRHVKDDFMDKMKALHSAGMAESNTVAAGKSDEPWTRTSPANHAGMHFISSDATPVREHSLWRHTSGRIYRVLFLTNTESTRLDKYPVTVIYRGENNNVWSRPLYDWHRSMTEVRV